MNFRAAADELGVTQGAVAQQVRGLEDHLGLRLFLREPRGLAFTDEGRAYHASVSRAFEQLSEATDALRSAPARVTVSVTPTFASKWLIPRLSDFTEAHPGIDLRITATERVASFHARPPFGASLRADLLFAQEVVAVCSPSLTADGMPLDAVGLARLTLLHDTHDLWPRFAQEAFESAVKPARRLRFNQTTLSLDAALAGQGVALASRFLVQRDLEAGRLVCPVPHVMEVGQDFYLLSPRQGVSSAAIIVRDWLCAVAKREAG